MGNAALPANWRVRWSLEPSSDGLGIFMRALVVDAKSVSMAALEHGLAAWGRSEDKLGATTIDIPQIPVLDDIWCLYMLAARERGEAKHSGWDAMSHYVEDVRRGYWPDRVKPEQAVQAVFSAIVHEHLAGATPTRDEFLADALELCRHVDAKLACGADLLDSDVTDAPKLQRYRAALASDHKLYDEDVERSMRWFARIPAERADGRERKVPLLVLRSPLARQFKMWARSDLRAPGGHGYPLLLVDAGKGEVVLSADPTSKLKVGWLAAGLDTLEGGDAHWYDGARHGFTLVAAPKGGTRLSLDEVVAYLRKELSFGRVWNHRRIRMASIAAAAVLVMGGSVAIVVHTLQKDPGKDIADANHQALYLAILPGTEPCTAFVIGTHELATAGHCLERGETLLIHNDDPKDQRKVIRSYRHKEYPLVDVGVFVVADPPLPKGVDLADEPGGQGASIYIFAFVQERLNRKHPRARMDHTTIAFEPTKTQFEHSAATSGGSSGGPIFNADGKVIAIHTNVAADKFGKATPFAGGIPITRLHELRSHKDLQVEVMR
ncbi:MAG TPA: serine protease [Kofleriaceae bacterium]|nr:serine protease [Kofleriaceae bacterium]